MQPRRGVQVPAPMLAVIVGGIGYITIVCTVLLYNSMSLAQTNELLLRALQRRDEALERSSHGAGKAPPHALREVPPGVPFVPFPSFPPHPKFKVYIQHVKPMEWHFERENLTYYLMREVLDRHSRSSKTTMVDVGANHGFFALYASALGVPAIAIEPQKKLAKLIRASAIGNGQGELVNVRNHAVALTPSWVTMMRTDGDGGTAFAVYKSTKEEGSIEALPLSSVLDHVEHVAFMKIDVEGFEVTALRSALPAASKIANFMVEFGPPVRFAVARRASQNDLNREALDLFEALRTSGYSLYITMGWCWKDYVSSKLQIRAVYGVPVMPVPPTEFSWLLLTMKHECMLWWTRDAPDPTPLPPDWDQGVARPRR
eukprot:Sspe_Gene.95244::Locus_67547_Transcript_1_1_Confidence_1.000_Length_1219::g.95244::m.95244